jgi:hypothetical protein
MPRPYVISRGERMQVRYWALAVLVSGGALACRGDVQRPSAPSVEDRASAQDVEDRSIVPLPEPVAPNFIVARGSQQMIWDGRKYAPEVRYDTFVVSPAEEPGWIRFSVELTGTNDHMCSYRGPAVHVSEGEWIGVVDDWSPRRDWVSQSGLQDVLDPERCFVLLRFEQDQVETSPVWSVGDEGGCDQHCGARMAPWAVTFDTTRRIEGACEPDSQMSGPHAMGPDCDWELLARHFGPP